MSETYPERDVLELKLRKLNEDMGAERVPEYEIDLALDRIYGRKKPLLSPVPTPIEKARETVRQARLDGVL